MFEKLSIREVVRFLCTGIVVLLGLVTHPGVMDTAMSWRMANAWFSDATAAVVVPLLTLLLGYVAFTVYRMAIYDWGILRLKGLLTLPIFGKRRWYDYRTLIRNRMRHKHGVIISVLEAERLYRIVRREVAEDYYKETAPDINTSLHFMYFTSFIALALTLFNGHYIWYMCSGIGCFTLALSFDVHQERDELLVLLSHRRELFERLANFVPNAIFVRIGRYRRLHNALGVPKAPIVQKLVAEQDPAARDAARPPCAGFEKLKVQS